jgi:hypothetical protein
MDNPENTTNIGHMGQRTKTNITKQSKKRKQNRLAKRTPPKTRGESGVREG